jgi:hypothetical protein
MTRKEGKIYFVQRPDGLVKIGYTADLSRRLRALAKGHSPLQVLRTINGDRKRERRLHAQFASLNQFGEWFRPDDPFLAVVARLPDGEASAVVASDIEREWIEGDCAMAEEARRLVKRLISVRRQRTGLKDAPAIDAVCLDHRLRPWTVRHIQSGRSTSVTAFALKRFREALIKELTAHRDDMLAELDDEAEALRLAARIQAKKEMRMP